ncbi:MAG: SPASM domain-containing protein [bacterium]
MRVTAIIETDLSPNWQGERGWILEPIQGKPALEHLLNRLKRSRRVGKIVFFGPARPENEPFFRRAKEWGIEVFSGDIAEVSHQIGTDTFLRVKGGNMLVDPAIIDQMIESHRQKGADYTCLVGLPQGTEAEVFSNKAWPTSNNNPSKTPFPRPQSVEKVADNLRVNRFEIKDPLMGPALKLGINRKEDAYFLSEIFDLMGGPIEEISLREAVEFLLGYQETLAEKMTAESNLLARKLYNKKLNMIECHLQKEELLSRPIWLQLELTSRCNLKCIMCGQKRQDGLRLGDMPLNLFKQTEDVLSYLPQVSSYGWGESLLHPDYLKMFRIMRKYQADVLLYTNGMRLTEEIAKEIVVGGCRDLVFSFAGATKETSEYIRRGLDFSRLVRAVEMVQDLKQRFISSKPNLRIAFLAMRKNIRELPQLVRLASSLGVKKILITYLVVNRPELRDESLYYHQELANEFLKAGLEEAKRLGVSIDLPGFFGRKSDNGSQRKVCYEPWTNAYISNEGKVIPCCKISTPLGDLSKHTFEEIWNSKAYTNFRQRVNSDHPPAECRECPFFKYQDINDEKTHLQLDGHWKLR